MEQQLLLLALPIISFYLGLKLRKYFKDELDQFKQKNLVIAFLLILIFIDFLFFQKSFNILENETTTLLISLIGMILGLNFTSMKR